MDGGRVVRSILWGVTHSFRRATRYATLLGRGLGYTLMLIGGLALFDVFSFIDPWSGVWFGILGLYLEGSARQSWLQTRALDVLAQYRAEDIMSSDLETAASGDLVRYLLSRGGTHYIFFISDAEDRVVGVLTEKEVAALDAERSRAATAGDVMIPTASASIAALKDDGATMLQRMEEASVWHLPVVDDGRVVGVVSKENLLRLLARTLMPRRAGSIGAGPS
jgi:CBS domain-containing protein